MMNATHGERLDTATDDDTYREVMRTWREEAELRAIDEVLHVRPARFAGLDDASEYDVVDAERESCEYLQLSIDVWNNPHLFEV